MSISIGTASTSEPRSRCRWSTATDRTSSRYRETLEKTFNTAVIENGLKWGNWDNGDDHRAAVLRTLDWLQQKNIPARGHVMVWPAYKNSPDWLPAVGKDPTALGHVIDTHIREVGLATRGMVRDWDVMNEAFDNQDFFGILGEDAMVHWFKVAEEVAPNVDLYYNDYAGLVRGGFPTGHKDHFEKTVRYLSGQRRSDRRHRHPGALWNVADAAVTVAGRTGSLARVGLEGADHGIRYDRAG